MKDTNGTRRKDGIGRNNHTVFIKVGDWKIYDISEMTNRKEIFCIEKDSNCRINASHELCIQDCSNFRNAKNLRWSTNEMLLNSKCSELIERREDTVFVFCKTTHFTKLSIWYRQFFWMIHKDVRSV